MALALAALAPAFADGGRAAHRVVPPGVVPAPAIDPLTLSPELRQWLEANVVRAGSSQSRLDRLLRALGSPEVGLAYDALATGGASEVFATRRFNCLAFAHLFVALARELGVDVYYLEVPRADRYRREGDLVLHSGHVTAAWGALHDRQAIELDVGPRVDYVAAVRITDSRALALHHVNRGAEALLADDLPRALAELARAIAVDPQTGAAWVNLGVAMRRSGDFERAEAAYREAIAVEPRGVAAYDNLYSLLQTRGREDAARELLDVVTRRAGPNPWLLLALGDSCLRSGDLDGAYRFYRRARSLARGEAAPAAAMAAWALATGDAEEARRWFRRAEGIDPQEPRLAALRQKLAASG